MKINKILTRDEFYANHVVCPKCKTSDNVMWSNIFIIRSDGKDFIDKLNKAHCRNCEWKGMRIDLLKSEAELA